MTTHIRLKPIAPPQPDPLPALPLPFVPGGAAVILGAGDPTQLAMPLAPSATGLFGPRGVCLVQETGPLWVADTGHHRVLGWRHCPSTDGQPADWVMGQPDFYQEGQNAKGPVGPATFSVPRGFVPVAMGWRSPMPGITAF